MLLANHVTVMIAPIQLMSLSFNDASAPRRTHERGTKRVLLPPRLGHPATGISLGTRCRGASVVPEPLNDVRRVAVIVDEDDALRLERSSVDLDTGLCGILVDPTDLLGHGDPLVTLGR